MDNLERELSNYTRIRRLEETDEEKIIYNQQANDVQLDITFEELQNSSNSIMEFLDGLNLFIDFNQNIEKYIYEINYQKKNTELLLNGNRNNNIHYEEMVQRLNELNSYSLDYYDKVNISYYEMKELIYQEIKEIAKYIIICRDITFNNMANKYIEINESFNRIEETINLEKNGEFEDNIRQDKDYNVKTTLNNYKVKSEFLLDIYFEEDNIKKPRLKGKVVNKIQSHNLVIDIYTLTWQKNSKIGNKYKPYFNNIESYSDISYDANLNVAIIDTFFNFQEYKIETEIYQNRETIKKTNKFGIELPTITPSILTSASKNETILSKNKKIQETYYY